MGVMDLLGQFGMMGGGEGPTGDYGVNPQFPDGGGPPMPMPRPDQAPGRAGDPEGGSMIPMPPPRPGGIDGPPGGGIGNPMGDMGGVPMPGQNPGMPPQGQQIPLPPSRPPMGPQAGGVIPMPPGAPPQPSNPMGDAGGQGGLPPDIANQVGPIGGAGAPPAPPAPPPQAQVPLPPPRPPMPPGSPALAPTSAPAAGALPVGGAPAGPPTSLAPPGQPPLPPFAQQPGQRPVPEMQVLRSDEKKMRQFGSGLGAGLSNIKGGGKFASFARGTGQGMQGSEKEQQRQEGTEDKQQGTHFNQLSTSFKDMLAAQNSQNAGALNKARAAYFDARAKAEGQGSKAWQNTPQGKILNVEKTIDARVDRALKLKAQQWKQNGTPEAQQKAEEQALRQQMETEKQGLYKQMGINPGDVEKIKTQGMSQQNPFDASKMTPEQFHGTVPLGAFYQSQDGKVYQRTQPPPGDKRSDAETANTDYAAATEEPAMTGANG